MNKEELQEVLELHKKWLNAEDTGVKADLSHASLNYAGLNYANLRGAGLSYADLRNANLEDANLRYANLSYANLRNADLRNADLRNANGNNKEVKSLQLGKYYVVALVGVKIHIGCQCHTIEQWENFTDEEISKMDTEALEWWKEWKDFILKVAKGETK